MTLSRCGVCVNPRSAEADAALTQGQAQAQVARLLGVSKHVVYRHVVSGHVPGLGAPGAGAPKFTPPDPDASTVEVMRSIVKRLNAVDTTAMSPRAASGHLDNVRRAAESLARIETPPAPPTDPDRPTWAQLQEMTDEWMTDLEPFPHVRQRIAARLRARMSGTVEETTK